MKSFPPTEQQQNMVTKRWHKPVVVSSVRGYLLSDLFKQQWEVALASSCKQQAN